MKMFNGSRDNEKECMSNANLVSLYAKRFGKGQWSFIGFFFFFFKKWYAISEDSLQGIWDKIAERMLVEFAESGCPIFRATTLLSRGQLVPALCVEIEAHQDRSGQPEVVMGQSNCSQ